MEISVLILSCVILGLNILVGLRSWPLNANDMDGVVSHKSAKTQRNKK